MTRAEAIDALNDDHYQKWDNDHYVNTISRSSSNNRHVKFNPLKGTVGLITEKSRSSWDWVYLTDMTVDEFKKWIGGEGC